jgi:hypothetical protein
VVDLSDLSSALSASEGFLDEVLFGYDWWNEYPSELDGVLQYHEGLQFAKSLAGEDFEWPSTEAPESTGIDITEGEFRPTTELYDMGYNVSRRAQEAMGDIDDPRRPGTRVAASG